MLPGSSNGQTLAYGSGAVLLLHFSLLILVCISSCFGTGGNFTLPTFTYGGIRSLPILLFDGLSTSLVLHLGEMFTCPFHLVRLIPTFSGFLWGGILFSPELYCCMGTSSSFRRDVDPFLGD